MKEYIERKVAEQAKPEFLNEKVEDYEKAIYAKGWNDCNTQYRENILSIPAADAVEVKHGHWIVVDAGREKCSECSRIYSIDALFLVGINDEPDYCPNCGAKMDGGADE